MNSTSANIMKATVPHHVESVHKHVSTTQKKTLDWATDEEVRDFIRSDTIHVRGQTRVEIYWKYVSKIEFMQHHRLSPYLRPRLGCFRSTKRVVQYMKRYFRLLKRNSRIDKEDLKILKEGVVQATPATFEGILDGFKDVTVHHDFGHLPMIIKNIFEKESFPAFSFGWKNNPQVGSIIEGLNSVVKRPWYRDLIGLCTMFVGLLRSWGDKIASGCHIVAFVNSLSIESEAADKLIEVLKNLLGSIFLGDYLNFSKPQGPDDILTDHIPYFVNNLLPKIGAAIMVVLGTLFTAKIPSVNSATSFVAIFSRLGSCVKTCEQLSDYGEKFVKYIINYVKVHFLGCPEQFVDEWKNIDAWCDEVNQIISTDFERNLQCNLVLKNKIDSLLTRGDDILKYFDKLKLPMTSRSRVQQCHMFLMKAREIAAHSGTGASRLRIPPLTIHIVGATSIGKSSLLYVLFAELLSCLDCREERDIEEKVHFRYAGSDERLDGAKTAHKIFVHDDIFMRKDSEQNPNPEVAEVVRLGNVASWVPPMSAMADKATTNVEPEVDVWTSNASNFKFESVTNPEAVIRRVGIRWEQFVADEFVLEKTINGTEVRMLDGAKANKAIQEDPMNVTKFNYFMKLDPLANTKVYLSEKKYTFEEFARINCEEVRENSRKGLQFIQTVKTYNEYVRNRDKDGWVGPQLQGVDDEPPKEVDEESIPDMYALFLKSSYYCAYKGEMYKDFTNEELVQKRLEDFKNWREMRAVKIKAAEEAYMEAQTPAEENSVFYYADNHIDVISASISHACDGVDNVQMTTKDYGNLRGASCVRATSPRPKVHLRIAKAFAVATATTNRRELEYPETSQEELDIIFNSVFWAQSEIQPSQIGRCNEHDCTGRRLNEIRARLHRDFIFAKNECLNKYGYSNNAGAILGLCEKWSREHTWFAVLSSVLTLGAGVGIYYFFKYIVKTLAAGTMFGARHLKRKIIHMIYGDSADIKEIFESHSHECATKYKEFADWLESYRISYPGRIRKSQFDEICVQKRKPTSWGCRCHVITGEAPKDTTTGTQNNVLEAYATNTTNGQKTNVIEAYATNTTNGPKTSVIEAYATNQTTGLKTHVVEAYATNQTTGLKTNVIESNTFQSILDQNAQELGPLYIRNLYKLEALRDGQWVHMMHLLIVKGRMAIVNKHVQLYSHRTQWRIRNASNAIGYEFNIHTLPSYTFPFLDEVNGKKDVMMVELPTYVPQHKDIVSKFISRADMGTSSTFANISLTGYTVTEAIQIVQKYTNVNRCVDEETHFTDSNGQLLTGYSIRHFYEYQIPTINGDCGALLCVHDTAFERKLVGIHAGGTNRLDFCGMGQPIHQDLLREMIKRMPNTRHDSLMHPDPKIDLEVVARAVNFEGLDVITYDNKPGTFHALGTHLKRPFQSGDSNIHPSVLHGLIAPVTQKPAYLHPIINAEGERVDPMELAKKKAGGQPPHIDPVLLATCAKDVNDKFYANVLESDRQVLTFEEAIAGRDGDEFMPGINRSTSPGFGWSKIGKGKTHWLGEKAYVFDNPELVAKYNEMLEQLKRGERPSMLWVDTLKDERRPIAKANEGKTRLFSVGEMVYQIIFRQYFLGWSAHMSRNRIDIESCVGINAYSRDWDRLTRMLLSKGKKVVAGDFSNYDGSLLADVLWACFDGIDKEFYQGTEEDSKVRAGLFSEIACSIHLFKEFVVMWTHSIPSGCAITAPLNSNFHSIIARVAFMLCAKKYCPEMYNITYFDKYVKLVDYGDDDVYNISDVIISWFNQHTITEALATIGMTYTDEEKSVDAAPYRSLNEVTFLKRAFRFDTVQARYRAPLSLITIREMAMWVHGKKDTNQLTATTLEEAVHELAQHDKETFTREVGAFEAAAKLLRGLRTTVKLTTYEHYQEIEHNRWCLGVGSTKLSNYPSAPDADLSDPDTATHINPSGVKSNASPSDPLIALLDAFEKNITAESGTYGNPAIFNNNSVESQGDLMDTLNNNNNQTTPKKVFTFATFQGVEDYASEAGTSSSAIVPGGDESVSEIQNQTVTFYEDGEVLQSAVAPSHALDEYLNAASDELTNDVKGFLERAIELKNFLWMSTQAVGVNTASDILLPNDFLARKMVREKVSGFKYLRCDFEITVQVNAQPFNAGRLMVWFEPFANQLQYIPSSVKHFGGISGYRHVDLDLSVATSVKFRIPYLCPLSHFDLITGYGDLGIVHTTVYSPLTGSTEVDGTIFIHAENIDIQMPTGMPMIPRTPSTARYAKFQGKEQIDSQKMRTKEVKQKGVVERISGTVSSVAGAISGIPVIGDIAKGVSMVSGVVSSLAEMFGWSKPTDFSENTSVQPIYARDMATFNGEVKAKSLAMDKTNAVTIPNSIYQTQDDEMAFNTILAKPIYTDRFTFANTDTQNSVIWKWAVSPESATTNGEPSGRYVFNTYLSFLSGLFAYWRGAIEYHFKFVKTVFHSGRLRVSFVPGADYNTDITTIDIDKVYSKIYDLRNTTEFSFSIPFVHNLPWKDLSKPGAVPEVAMTGTYTGVIYVEVINALRNPTSAANSIDVIVESCAGEDFQFAYFTNKNNSPPQYFLPTTEFRAPNKKIHISRIGCEKNAMYFYGDDEVDKVEEQHYATFQGAEPFFTTNKMTGTKPNELGIGEAITSFRQLLKRYTPFGAPLVGPGPDEFRHYSPFLTGHAVADSLAFDRSTFDSPLEYATFIYRFTVGSMRLMFQAIEAPALNEGHPLKMKYDAVPKNEILLLQVQQPFTNSLNPNSYLGGPESRMFPTIENVVELDIPFYENFPTNLTGVGAPIVTVKDVINRTPFNIGGDLTVDMHDTGRIYDVLRAVGEDFHLGYLIGPPIGYHTQ